jgi:general secretion pathway protein J
VSRRVQVRGGRGFTLIELLVALFITAILFAMGYGALSQALTSKREVEEQSARLNALQQAVRIMEQDFELMQPRPARDLLGNGYEAPLVVSQNAQGGSTMGQAGAMGGEQGPALLSFTRGGWANPAGLPRSELERVSYLVRDGKLVRQNLPTLDTTAATAIVERELLDGVEALSFRFMDESLTWSASWPSAPMQSLPPAALLRARPVAIEITLRIRDVGVLTRIVEIAG